MNYSCAVKDNYEKSKDIRKRLMARFDSYASLFLPRLGSRCPSSEEFKAFFRYQLATYLGMKNNYSLALPEGDMISDLILDTYEEFEEEVESSDLPISKEGRINLLLKIRIQFPWQSDTDIF